MSSTDGEIGPVVVLGSEDGEHMAIRMGRPGAEGWGRATVDVTVGGFTAHVSGELQVEELSGLGAELRGLHERLAGEVVFASFEGWLEMRFVGDALGHLTMTAEVRDSCAGGNALRFTLPNFDRGHLPGLARSIERVVAALHS